MRAAGGGFGIIDDLWRLKNQLVAKQGQFLKPSANS